MADWPLAGRDEELAAIDAATRRQGASRGIVLAGMPGVGKTRLAREALSHADVHGRSTHWIAASASSRHLPFGAFALALGDLGGDPTQVLQRAADALLAVPGQPEPVIVVDDAHLLDDLSASLVQQLVTHQKATVVLTVRTGETSPPAIEAVWKDGYLDRLEVQALSREETTGLLTAALRGPLSKRSAHRLYDLSEGNVLFLRHIVAGELAAGRLAAQAGTWRWDGGFAVSTELAELVGGRLAGLPEKVGELLDLLALAGPLDPRTLGELVSPGTVEDAELDGLVRVDQQGGQYVVRLDHPLYGEVRLTRMGELRARRLRGAVATALDGMPDNSPAAALRRAVLSLGSDLPREPELLVTGAQAALQVFDWDLGRRLAAAAVESGGGFEATLALSYALGFAMDPDAADRILAELESTASDDLQRLRATVPRAGHLYYVQGRVAEAVLLLEDARAALHDLARYPIVDGMRAMLAAMSGHSGEALRLADEALRGGPLPPLVALCANWARVVALAAIGRTDQIGEAEVQAHLQAAGSYDSCLPRLGYRELHVRSLRLAGRVREAATLADRFRPDLRDAALTLTLMADCVVGQADLAIGRVASAREAAGRCIDGLLGHDTSGWIYTSTLTLATACAMAGDADAARAAAELMERGRHPGFVIYEPDRMLAWAWVEAADGAIAGAVRRAREAAVLAAERGQWGCEAFSLATAVRFGDSTVADRLVALSASVDGPRVAAAAQQAVALAAGDGSGLLEASRSFEEMGDLLSAADAAAQAAACFADPKERAAHHEACSRARRLQTECQGALTPALAAALHPLPLTAREREIVTLAGSGLSNREIADRLVVSVRTVEGHLYRAAAKLGTTDRARFRALLHGD